MLRLGLSFAVALSVASFARAEAQQAPSTQDPAAGLATVDALVLESEKLVESARLASARGGQAEPRMVQRHRDLGAHLVAVADGVHPAFARLLANWYECAERTGMPRRESTAIVQRIEERLAQLGGFQRGRATALRILTRRAFNDLRPRPLREHWHDLYEQHPGGVRRVWLATSVARNLVAMCDDYVGADRVLTAALRELDALGPWSAAEAAALQGDADIVMTMPDRAEAGSWHDALGSLLLLRGFARLRIGDTVAAIADLEAARPPLERCGNEHRLANIGHNLAFARLQLGDWAGALAVAERTERIYDQPVWHPAGQPDENGVWAMRHARARALLERAEPGDEAAAAALLRGILEEFEARYSETNGEAAFALIEVLLLGAVPVADADELERLFTQARDVAVRSPAAAAELDVLAARRSMLDGDDETAVRLARRAIGFCDGRRLPHLVVRAELVLAEVDRRDLRFDAAIAAYHRAADTLLRTVIDQQLWRRHGSAQTFLRRFDRILHGALQVLWQRAAGRVPTATDLADFYALLQKFRGFESWCWVRLGRAGDPLPEASAADTASESAALGALRVERERLLTERVDLEAAPGRDPRSYFDRLQRLRENAVALDQLSFRLVELQRRSLPQLGAMVGDPADLAKVQRAVRPGELLVECVELGDVAVALVIRRDAATLRELPSGAVWRDAVAAWRRWSRAPTDDMDAADVVPLRAIERHLVPAGGWLETELRRCRQLLWSPVGSFCDLPLAALSVGERRLCERVCIGHVISGSVLAFDRATDPADERAPLRLLALGNPRYQAATVSRVVLRSLIPGGGFEGLPETSHEVLEVARLFATAEERRDVLEISAPERFDGELAGARFRVLLGSAARKRALTPEALAAADVLHFACHGRSDPQAPARSFLALSMAARDAHVAGDELLWLSELCGMRGDYQLVCLSACATAAGLAPAHASSLSMTWAARMAGARRVLGTGWPLSDGGARRLFVAYFEEWLRDRGRAAQALRRVQEASIGVVPVRDWASLQLWGGRL